MEMLMVKGEENMGKRRMRTKDGENPSSRCVKRRRRDISGVALSSDNPQQQQPRQVDQILPATTVKRSSKFRDVSRHRWTGRYEAHLWDKLSWNVTQKKKGKQVYLGAYDEEESAARAYDLTALKYWGASTFTNFPKSDYEKEIEIMQCLTKEEYLASLRRKSSGFSRGVSKYRGVARHHHNGRWEARIGRVFGNKYLYLGTYSTQEEAARAYDIAAIEFRGINAVTNFDLSTYIRWLKPSSDSPLSADKTLRGPPFIEASRKVQSSINSYIAMEGCETPFGQHTRFTKTYHLTSHLKQEGFDGDFYGQAQKKPSSPSALGLLLRSSIFRELVAKNSNTEDETEGDDTKHQKLVSIDDELNQIFFSGEMHDVPYTYSSSDSSLELQGGRFIF